MENKILNEDWEKLGYQVLENDYCYLFFKFCDIKKEKFVFKLILIEKADYSFGTITCDLGFNFNYLCSSKDISLLHKQLKIFDPHYFSVL